MTKLREGIAGDKEDMMFFTFRLLNLTLVLFFLVSTLLEGVPFLRLGERPGQKHADIHTFMMMIHIFITVFDTCFSFTFFSKTLDPSVAKIGSEQVNNINFGFLMVKMTHVPLPWQHEKI